MKLDAKVVIKACPFCGQWPEVQPYHGGKPTKHMISCPAETDDECGAGPSVTGETLPEAIEKWNRRAP